jgi:hypothetical protein
LETFKKTFDVIAANGGDTVFHKWHAKRKYFFGAFLNTAFEVFALGLGYRIANGLPYRTDLLEIAREFWTLPELKGGFATGRATEARLVDFIPRGRLLLAPPP